MRLGRSALGVCAAAALATSIALPSHAAEEVDQSTESKGDNTSSAITGSQSVAQTFTAGITGTLTAVGLGVSKTGEVSDLTVEIKDTSGDVPTGASLASTVLEGTALEDVPGVSDQRKFKVNFDSPTQVTEGGQYAIVLSTTAGLYDPFFRWYYAEDYDGGRGVAYTTGWQALPADLTFTTYVTVNSGGGSTSSPASAAPSIQLVLRLPDGTACGASSPLPRGAWAQLPSASACTPEGAPSGSSLLGWATNADFPIDIAQRQVDNGWGAYETFNSDGQLTGVFIPAGGYTLVSNDTNLYPIFSS